MRPYHYVYIITLLALLAMFGYGYGNPEWQLSRWWLVLFFTVALVPWILGSIYIQWNFYVKSHNKGKNTRQVALTFDDGPNEGTAAILDILKVQDVKATFFVIGKNVIKSGALLQRLNDEGHLIGNHSARHGFNFDWQTATGMVKEIEAANGVIKQMIGKRPLLFRPPYGVTNIALAKAIKRTGMQSIGWNIRSFDTKAKDPQQLLNRILNQVKGGDIILLHDQPVITRDILTELITSIRQKGYTFVRIDELLDIKAYA